MRWIEDHWPIGLSLATLGCILAGLCAVVNSELGGFEYALDDAYIHMAVAKHLVEDGVWGSTPYEFSSSSSSLMWTAMLAALRVVHLDGQLVPLALNVMFAAIALVVFDRMLAFDGVTPLVRAGSLLGIIAVAAMAPIIFTGMEHTLQIVLTIGFLYLAARAASGGEGLTAESPKGRVEPWILVLAPLVTGIRYEGMFPLVLVCVLFALCRRWRFAALLGVLGFAPLVAFGLYAMSQGGFFFPNTILLKAKPPTRLLDLLIYLIGFQGDGRLVGLPAIVRFPYILSLFLALVIALVVLRRDRRPIRDWRILFLLLNLGTLLLHMQFARIGWFYRYEGYLYAGTILAVVLALHDRLGRWLTPLGSARTWIRIGGMILLASTPLAHGLLGIPRTPASARRIHEYERQSGLFFQTFYTGESVAIGEIGLNNYLADLRALDYEGLGSTDAARVLLHHGRMPREELARLAHDRGAKIALGHKEVWDSWKCLPEDWIFVGEWDAHDPTRPNWEYRFYAVEPGEAGRLRSNLEAFQRSLPSWVETRLQPLRTVDIR